MESTVVSSESSPGARPAGRRWLGYALVTTITWGLWGAWGELPARAGFPETLSYVVWALTMLLPAAVVLRRERLGAPIDARSIALGLAIGLSGAGGVILLFPALSSGPAYLIFPIISLAPVVTIGLSTLLLGERTGALGAAGIVLSLLCLPLLNDWTPGAQGQGLGLWFALSLLILVLWGLQNYFIKLAHARWSSADIFFYMTLGGLLLVPVALARTDWSAPVNWGWSGLGLSAGVQMLNAVGSLSIVYAMREGKAIVVTPLTNAASPLITAFIAIAMHGDVPGPYKLAGIGLAILASALLALQGD